MMIRKSTWAVLGVFFVLALAAIFLRWSPSSPIKTPTTTPASTASAYAIQGILSTDVTAITLERTEGKVELVRNADLTWTRNGADIVSAGKVEELLSNIVTIRVLTELAPDYALDSVGLNPPAQTITLTAADRTLKITVGGLTPTATGNYIQVDTQPVFVVSKYAVEAILLAFDNALPNTPTPEVIETAPSP